MNLIEFSTGPLFSPEVTEITAGQLKALIRRASWFQTQGFDLSLLDGRSLSDMLGNYKKSALLSDCLAPWFWSIPDDTNFFIGCKPTDLEKDNICYFPLKSIGPSVTWREDPDGVPADIGHGVLTIITVGSLKYATRVSKEVVSSLCVHDGGDVRISEDAEEWVESMLAEMWMKLHLESWSANEIYSAMRTICSRTMDAKSFTSITRSEVYEGIPAGLIKPMTDVFLKHVKERFRVLGEADIKRYNDLVNSESATWERIN